MFKRILAAFLWIWAGSTVDGLVAYATGQSIVLGLVLGVAIAVVVTVDPRHVIWTRGQDKSPQEPAQA